MGKIVSPGEEEFIIVGHNLKNIKVYLYLFVIIINVIFSVYT